MISISEIDYMGWPRCIQLSNGTLEMVIVTAIGPRVIHFSGSGGQNLFMVDEKAAGQQGGDQFRLYGGHRLWRSPEDFEQTYFPDNVAVTFAPSISGGRFTAPIEPTTHLQKEVEIALEDGNSAVVTHRITNYAPYPQDIAAWALSILRAGGVAILPLPDYRSHTAHVLPTNSLVLWGYTDLSDPRWQFNTGSVYLWQDESATTPQKIGLSHGRGWLAYCHPYGTMVKQYLLVDNRLYPDRGSVAEVFTNHDMLELETLSPITALESGETIQHLERWILLPSIESTVLEQPQAAVQWIESQL